jgi:hypothetical protein
MKADLREIPEFQETSQTEVVRGEGGQRTVTCQILIAPSFAIHVIMHLLLCKARSVVLVSLSHCLLQSNDLKLIF